MSAAQPHKLVIFVVLMSFEWFCDHFKVTQSSSWYILPLTFIIAPFISNLIKSSILMGNCLLNSQNLCFKNWFCIIGRRKKSINSEESLWFPIKKNVWLGLIYTPSSLLSLPVLSVHSYVLKQPGLIIECLE